MCANVSLHLILWTLITFSTSIVISMEIPRDSSELAPGDRTSKASSSNMAPRLNDSSQVVVLVINPPSSFNASQQDDEDLGQSKLNKRRLIRGSKRAVTITKKEYLKKDWCQTEPFQQIISEKGCRKKRVLNRFCYGQCNSFFIPKTDRKDQDAGSFRSCAYCTPVISEWLDVELDCPSLSPPRKTKRIQIVKQCKCMAVNLEASLINLETV